MVDCAVALTNWLFLYTAPGMPEAGEVHAVRTTGSTTVLAGFPSAAAAIAACERPQMVQRLAQAELVELCGGFARGDVDRIRALRPEVPVGRVTYDGIDADRLHRLFA